MTSGHTERAGVKSDETLFAIIAHLHESGGAGVTELASSLGLAKSTVHDHLATMRDHGFAVKCGDAYHLGLQFFRYGQSVRNGYDVYRAARAVVDDVAETTDESAWLMAYQQGRVMCLYGDPGETDINVNTLVGSWAYMHCNSGGKAILANMSDEEVTSVVDRFGLPAQTDSTITDRDELEAELETVRKQGYALNMGEDLAGIHAVSVPLLFEPDARCALAIAGPAHQVTRERCENELAERLFAARNEIELNLAYS